MKKLCFLTVFLTLLIGLAQAQQKLQLTGKVLDEKTGEALPFVAVYLNNTTAGATTNAKGEFTFSYGPGKYQLIVSFTGYEPLIKELLLDKEPQPFTLKLKPKAKDLQEISITARRKKNSREHLKLFKEQFLGQSPVAQKCKILNPDALHLYLNPETGVLEGKARDVLLIENPELGYRVKYLLADFKFDTRKKYVTLLGNASFEPLKGSKVQEFRWDKNRQKAYNGSVMHFVRALRSQQLEAEGFYLRKLKKTPNPELPSEAEIANARKLLQRGNLEFGLNNGATEILKRAKLPPFVYELDTASVPYSEYLVTRGDEVKMTFPGYFQVIYTGEKEDIAYTAYRTNYESLTPGYQYSAMHMLGKSVTLEPAGNFTSPLDIFLDGYWAWEKTGDRLPLDYKTDAQPVTPPKDELVAAIAEPLGKFNVSHAPEKVYVHLDKPYYVAGEDIWYKAYLVNGITHAPDSVSQNLYVELLSPLGQVIKRNIMKIKAGVAAGDFSMEDTLRTGTYTLRAYTNWMRNFPAGYFFTREINIWNDIPTPQTAKQAPETQAAALLTASTIPATLPPALDVQFFPESGNLVTGVESKVGFKAVNSAGKGEDISGSIIDATGKEITSFQSLHFGMGSFVFTPAAGQTYSARIKSKNGKSSTVTLPAIQEKGYSMRVNNAEEDLIQIIINQRGNKATANDLILTAQVRGQVVYSSRFQMTDETHQLLIPKINIPSGVAQLTLFTAYPKEPLCERLVFVNKNDNLKLSVAADKKQYAPREKVQLALSVTDAEDNPVETNLSIAVTDATLKPDAYSQNLNSYLLLSSDLTGTIEQQGFYFKDNAAETRLALDNLMLTQGWRRFIWKDLFAGNLPEIKFPTERSLSLSGKVQQIINNKPVANGKVMLTLFGDDMRVIPTFTNPEGLFSIKNLDFAGYTSILIQAETDKGNERTNITLTDNQPAAIKQNMLFGQSEIKTGEPAVITASYIKQAQGHQKLADTHFYGKNVKVLEEVKVNAKRPDTKAPAIYGSPNRVIKVDKSMERFRNILTALEGKDVGLAIKYLPILSEGFTVGYEEEPVVTLRGRPILILVDGFRVYDFNIINSIHPSEVESVEVIKNASGIAMGTEAYNGILAINLKKGNAGRSQAREGSLSTRLQGYHKVREFYVPQYDIKKEEHSLPDKRSTLYWNPIVKTDATGKAKVVFYNSDEVTNMRVTVEGVSQAGLVGSQTEVIGK